MDLPADIEERRAAVRVDTCHAAVAYGREQHCYHREQDGGDDVPARFVVDDSKAGHGGRGLDEDDAVEDEVAEAQATPEACRLGGGLQVRHQFPCAVAVAACGVRVTDATFQPSMWIAGSAGASS